MVNNLEHSLNAPDQLMKQDELMSSELRIRFDDEDLKGCETAIVVPEQALTEAGYIKTYTLKDTAHAKHEMHALAQMVYFQYQDDELEVSEAGGAISVENEQESSDIENGMVLMKMADGSIMAVAQGMINKKKYLEAAYRYCTRWVRLDI